MSKLSPNRIIWPSCDPAASVLHLSVSFEHSWIVQFRPHHHQIRITESHHHQIRITIPVSVILKSSPLFTMKWQYRMCQPIWAIGLTLKAAIGRNSHPFTGSVTQRFSYQSLSLKPSHLNLISWVLIKYTCAWTEGWAQTEEGLDLTLMGHTTLHFPAYTGCRGLIWAY